MNNAGTALSPSRRFWQAASIAGVNAVVSMGFAIATVAAESSSTAWYAADRAAALLVALAVVVALRHRAGLLLVGWMLVGVQAVDALIGLGTADVTKVVGPAVLAVATGVALALATRSAD
jgi:hypothetical protein